MWRRRLAAPVLCVFLTLTAAGAHAQAPRFEALADTVAAMMEAAGVPGLAMALVEDGAVVWSRGFGVRSTVTRPPVEAGTVFEAGAMGMPVLAYVVLQLADEGMLDLDRPLPTYLPAADVPDERLRRVTARQVLSHTAGFPASPPPDGELVLDFDPGTRFQYSGLGYLYLQRIVEHVTGQSLQDLAVRRVFEPLGMTETSFVWERRFGPHLAAGHREDGVALDKLTPEVPQAAWSLHTTAPDYARFLVAVLHGEGLSTAAREAMLTPLADAEEGIRWGLGWGLQPGPNGVAFWHWGDNVGYKSFALLDTSTRKGLVLLTNSENGMLLLQPLLRVVLGREQPAADWLGYDRYDDPRYQITAELFRIITTDGVAAALARHEALKAAGMYPPDAFGEDLLNALGYRLLRTGRVEEAIAVFRRNVELFPEAYNPYDSLGEAYLMQGNLRLALENYQKSVALNPGNTHGARMIQQLRAALLQPKGQ